MNGLVREGSIGEVLFKSRIITEAELKAALEAQKESGCRVGEALVQMGVVTQEDIDWALSHQLNIPYVRLKKQDIDPAATARVPAKLARRFQLIPLVLSGDDLSVAMADPLNKDAIEAVSAASGCQITISVGLVREIREMQDLVYGPDSDPSTMGFTSELFDHKTLETLNADLSGAALLNHLLMQVVQQQWGALALQPVGEVVLATRRSAGKVAEVGRLGAVHYPRILERLRQLAKLDPTTRSADKGLILLMWQGKRIPFQIFLMRAAGGEYVTIKPHVSIPCIEKLSELELSPGKREDLAALGRAGNGLVLFAVREHEERSRFIDLFLDSCETEGKTVLLIGEGIGRGERSFPRIPVLRDGVDETRFLVTTALEHEPDVLVIEDVTEIGAFIAASKAVMRGKLVVAGIALSNKESALKQLLYLHHKNFLIPSQLRGVVCAKGVLTLCPQCKEKYTPAPEELLALRLPAAHFDFFRPVGCPACDHAGYDGKRYLLDVIRFEPRLLEAFEVLREGGEVVRFMKDNGYRGISEEGIELLERGEITPGEYVAAILL